MSTPGNSSKLTLIIAGVGVVVLGAVFFFQSQNQFDLPQGETRLIEERSVTLTEEPDSAMEEQSHDTTGANEEDAPGVALSSPSSIFIARGPSTRDVFETDGTIHSIPLNEILSGGPPKDGIPSIDDPKFIDTVEGNSYVSNEEVGLGLEVNGDARFYPYNILVWHEIVNDTVGGEPVLVTYCPLCATGVVFERRVNGEVQEFGVSGRLWQSNLLMYNRAGNEDNESLWSQVLGEAVLGVNTGERLRIVRSDIVQWGEWKKLHPDTSVLSRDTGALRSYGVDPYGDYYTNESVSFGATFTDERLHPKAFVLGVELDGAHKAYHREALQIGVTTDTFEGRQVRITKGADGEISITADGEPLPYIGGFWFSWLAVHPDTELYN